MAVDTGLPIIVKILFPPLFVLEWFRHFFHKFLISHVGPGYWKDCKDLSEEQNNEIKDFVTSSSDSPTILEFGCGPRPSYDAFPLNVNLILVEPCSDFNQQIFDSWEKSEHCK